MIPNFALYRSLLIYMAMKNFEDLDHKFVFADNTNSVVSILNTPYELKTNVSTAGKTLTIFVSVLNYIR